MRSAASGAIPTTPMYMIWIGKGSSGAVLIEIKTPCAGSLSGGVRSEPLPLRVSAVTCGRTIQKVRLGDLLKMNLKIVEAYLLKELFRKLWEYTHRAWAAKYLKRWFWWATHSRLTPLRDFAWTLRRHEEGILTYFDLRISNGLVEAMNNNARVISHRARGYRSEHNYSLALIHGLGKLEVPKTQHKFW